MSLKKPKVKMFAVVLFASLFGVFGFQGDLRAQSCDDPTLSVSEVDGSLLDISVSHPDATGLRFEVRNSSGNLYAQGNSPDQVPICDAGTYTVTAIADCPSGLTITSDGQDFTYSLNDFKNPPPSVSFTGPSVNGAVTFTISPNIDKPHCNWELKGGRVGGGASTIASGGPGAAPPTSVDWDVQLNCQPNNEAEEFYFFVKTNQNSDIVTQVMPIPYGSITNATVAEDPDSSGSGKTWDITVEWESFGVVTNPTMNAYWLPEEISPSVNVPIGPLGTKSGQVTYEVTPKAGRYKMGFYFNFCGYQDFEEVTVEVRACETCNSNGGDTVGGPVNVHSGDMVYQDADPIPGAQDFPWVRTYNSSRRYESRFGWGWRSPFDSWLKAHTPISSGTPTRVSLETEAGHSYTFIGLDGKFVQLEPKSTFQAAELSAVPGVFTFREPGSDWERDFELVSGAPSRPYRIKRYRNVRTGRVIEFTHRYQSGLYVPDTVTDSWGHWTWKVFSHSSYPTKIGAIRSTVNLASNQEIVTWEFSYDRLNRQAIRLQSSGIRDEGSLWRDYDYDVNHNLTRIENSLGHNLESHDYVNGRAINSIMPDGEFTLEYGTTDPLTGESTTKVTIPGGDVRDYRMGYRDGSPVVIEKTGHCSSCSANDASHVYDERGRITRRQDARGFISTTIFDEMDRVESSTIGFKPASCNPTDVDPCLLSSEDLEADALATTPETLTSTYAYTDSKWPERATIVTTQSAINSGHTSSTTMTYHQDFGTLLTRTSTGWTDYHDGTGLVPETRISETFLYDGTIDTKIDCADFNICGAAGGGIDWDAVQPVGFTMKTDGTRTDVDDFTFYAYYPVDSSVPGTWRGQLAAIKNAADHITRFEDYDGFGNALTVIDPNGVVTTRVLNDFSQQTDAILESIAGCNASTDPDPTCDQQIISKTEYHPGGGPARLSFDPDGDVTHYEYDHRGRVYLIERGPSETEYLERIYQVFDDNTGKLKQECNLAYTPAGSAQSAGNNSPTAADPGKDSPLGPPEDSPGIVHFHNVDPNWTETKTVRYEYDVFARLEKVVYPITEASQTKEPFDFYVYDRDDNVLSVQDAEHTFANVSYSYDSRSRLLEVNQLVDESTSTWASTTYDYDIQSNLVAVTDANNNVTSYVFDDFGQTLEVDSPVTGISKMKFDLASNVKETEDARGAVLERAYDELNRILTEDVPSSVITGPAGVNYPIDQAFNQTSVEWTYDEPGHGFGKGRLTTVVDQVSTHTFEYERRGLTTNKHTIYISQGDWQVADGDFEMIQQYDIDGNPTVRIYPSQMKVTTGYDWADRPESVGFQRWVIPPRGGGAPGYGAFEPIILNTTYVPFGPMAEKEFANGWKENRTYDKRYFLDELSVRMQDLDFDAITHNRYIQDNVGNITDITDLTNSITSSIFGNGQSGRQFVYDDLYRLTQASALDTAGQSTLYGSFGYGLDIVGNRLNKAQTEVGSTTKVTDIYSYQAGPGASSNNSILETVTQGMTTKRDNLFDDYGNPTDDGQTYYWYDNRNRLLGEQGYVGTTNTGSLRHLYDYTGRRAGHFGASIPSNCPPGGCAPTNVSYAFAAFWGDENICSEVWPGQPENGVVDRIYFAGTPVALIWAGFYGDLTRINLSDHLGTTYASGDETGSLLWRAEYDPFGKVAKLTVGFDPMDPNNTIGEEDPGFRFPGQELDHWFRGDPNGPTELYYNVHRYYDPEIGRYTQPDPIGLEGGGNTFQYAESNPIIYFDPTGLKSVCDNVPRPSGCLAACRWDYRKALCRFQTINRAAAALGGIAGAVAGGKIGAAVGGVGAIPGVIIGGTLGALGVGSFTTIGTTVYKKVKTRELLKKCIDACCKENVVYSRKRPKGSAGCILCPHTALSGFPGTDKKLAVEWAEN